MSGRIGAASIVAVVASAMLIAAGCSKPESKSEMGMSSAAATQPGMMDPAAAYGVQDGRLGVRMAEQDGIGAWLRGGHGRSIAEVAGARQGGDGGISSPSSSWPGHAP